MNIFFLFIFMVVTISHYGMTEELQEESNLLEMMKKKQESALKHGTMQQSIMQILGLGDVVLVAVLYYLYKNQCTNKQILNVGISQAGFLIFLLKSIYDHNKNQINMKFEGSTPEPSRISEKEKVADIYHLNNQKKKNINAAEEKKFNIESLKDIIVNLYTNFKNMGVIDSQEIDSIDNLLEDALEYFSESLDEKKEMGKNRMFHVLNNFVVTYFDSAEVNITSLGQKTEDKKLEEKKDIWHKKIILQYKEKELSKSEVLDKMDAWLLLIGYILLYVHCIENKKYPLVIIQYKSPDDENVQYKIKINNNFFDIKIPLDSVFDRYVKKLLKKKREFYWEEYESKILKSIFINGYSFKEI